MRNSPGIIATPSAIWQKSALAHELRRLARPDMTEDDDLVEFTPEDGAGAL